jgi:hypothetical protein
MVINIIMGVVNRWKEIELAEGVVLIDELEVHLHPRWKMEIVGLLRQVFPKMTFLVTTHDPLCLRGLQPGEVIVLRFDGERVQPRVITESLAHLRADQLLTSELFGLVGTRDPDINQAIQRHAELSSNPSRSAEEKAELQALSSKLTGNLPTAETKVERITEQVFDQILAEQVLPEVRRKLADPIHMASLPIEAKKTLESLLNTSIPPEVKT